MKREDWEGEVYRKVVTLKGKKFCEWRLLRDETLRRDRFTCVRCDVLFKYKKQLTAHHLIPREDGGPDVLDNLVTLCSPCHDYVEIRNLRTMADIIGSCESKVIEVKDEPEPDSDDWHTWVYGGKRRPQN